MQIDVRIQQILSKCIVDRGKLRLSKLACHILLVAPIGGRFFDLPVAALVWSFYLLIDVTSSKARPFEWTDLKFFLELVRSGNPTSAGRRLKVDHNTVRRRVAALEAAFQSRLFSSHGASYDLNVEGETLYKYAEAIEALTIRAEEAVTTSDMSLSGTVRIGVPDCFGLFFLAKRLAELSLHHPDLRLNVVVLPQVVNISNRDADIAVLLSPPNQMRQITRKLTDYSLHLYSTSKYLQTVPAIQSIADMAQCRFVGYIPDLLNAPQLDVLPELAKNLEAHFESNSIAAQLEALLGGGGLCVLPDFIASGYPELVPVLADSFSLKREYWLAIHPEMINLARVRAVIDSLVEFVRSEPALFLPKPMPHGGDPTKQVR